MDFTFHDLKAKGISDLDGTLQEKQAISGHKSAGQTARYARKTKIVDSVEGHKKKRLFSEIIFGKCSESEFQP